MGKVTRCGVYDIPIRSKEKLIRVITSFIKCVSIEQECSPSLGKGGSRAVVRGGQFSPARYLVAYLRA